MSKHSMRMLALAVALALAAAASLAEPAKGPESPGTADRVTGSSAPHNLLFLQVDSTSAGATEIQLVTDGAVEFDSFVLDDPARLVVDLQNVVSRLDRQRYDVASDGLARVRTAQHQVDPVPVARIVFDLDRPLDHAVKVGETGIVVSVADRTPSLWLARNATDSSSEDEIRDAAPAATAAPATGDRVASLVAELEGRHPELEPDVNDTIQPATPAGSSPAMAEPPVQHAAIVPGTAALSTDAATVPASQTTESRAVEPDLIERLLKTPTLAAPRNAWQQRGSGRSAQSFKTKTIGSGGPTYGGKEISLNLVDADLKQVFRLFHEISGLNFVLDPSVTGRVTIVLDQVPWDQALDIILKNNGLDKVLENNVIRIATTQKLAQEAAARKQLKEAEELEVEPITITRTLSYAKAADVERVIRDGGILTPRGKVIVDERTNTLIVSDVPKKVEPVDTLISTLDSETPQVMIEARIVETSRDFVQDLGVVWGFAAIADASRGTSSGITFPHNAAVRYGLNLPGEGGASSLAFKFGNVIDSFTLDVALNTLETEGQGRVLSSPKVATQNNERAEIEQGVRIPIVNTTATEINVEFVSASLKMSVTPQITAEGTIILEVTVENNSPDFVNTAGGIPSIRTQRAQTKVLINDGGTTVIGGIFTVNEGQSEVGVPWFRKIPVFGWLFKQRNITSQNRELLIFITPKIMRMT